MGESLGNPESDLDENTGVRYVKGVARDFSLEEDRGHRTH